MNIVTSILFSVFSLVSAAQTADEPQPFVRSGADQELRLDLRDDAETEGANGVIWKLSVESAAVPDQPDAKDYHLTWTVTKGQVESASVGIVFEFKDWSPENFVFVPAAVYNGNRFDIKRIGYPPYWYDPNEWRIDMPTTMTPRNPTLGRGPGGGRIRLNTSDAAVPLLAWQSLAEEAGWMVQTTQDSRFGNHQILIEENDGRTAVRFEIYTPAGSWKAGDTVTIPVRVYNFPAKTRNDLFRRFFSARKDLNPARRKEELPFSAAWGLLNDLYQNHRWDERTGLYWFSEPGSAKNWNSIWQLGWCGGGQNTLAMLIQGDEQTRQRARRNLDTIFAKTQAPSGFFYAIGNGDQFASFGFGQNFKHNECLVRSQGDWLYMAQRQFNRIKAEGGKVLEAWMTGLKKEADAFARVWDKYGQFGQFVDVETGDLCIGGSTSGAIVPGGMALASRTFNESSYLKVAEAAARKYYRDFVRAGYTTGGPGEILSAPDSESAFGLFESYMALHEITGGSEWLRYANDLLPICASWVVAYDYHFPTNSPMGRIDAHSCSAVWANVQNKHGAPAICTWSGDSLLKYYRATGDRRALDLLIDIAHGVPQYISRIDHRIGCLKPGEMCERVNLSAWEGQRNVGGSIFGSRTWVETAAMLTVTQLPGLYVQPDTGLAVAFDNVCIEELSHAGKTVKFRLTNPTNFAADVSVLVESVEAARRPMGSFVLQPLPLVHLDAGTSTTLEYTVSRSSSIEAEAADTIGGASKTADSAASGGDLVSLTKPGQGVRFTGLPAGSKLAIRYASVEAGTISVAVNDQPARRVNVHSSGALTGSFLHAILDVAVPANAMLTISLAADDVPVNIDRILVGDGDLGLPPDIWNLPPLKVADGPYAADWKALSRVYTVPQWWRDAKFGAWAHWDPQSMPERGDWYARGMYQEGHPQYNFHVKHFGHPSEYGYKDICHNWVIDRWKPEELMDLFVEMGARYFMAMGVHHDNFDCWDSAYQPWNSVRVGPKVDVVGTWEKVARQRGLRFGIGFHNSPPRTWGQFMPVRYTSDKKGPKKGVPYDALQTILDGKGKWWEGMDPVDLYGPVHNNKNPLLSPFANQFMWRVDDAVTKYHPDVIYFDEAAGDTLVDLGVKMGLGFLAPPLVANYYNKSLKWNQGKMDVVINLKCVGGRYNSFKNTPELIPIVERALVKSTEADIEPEIRAYPFQTETTIADWHYQTGQKYLDAKKVIGLLMQNVSRNGTMLLNLTQHGRGDLDPQVIRICKDIGAWLKINGEAVYGSRPFEICGENANSICYTRNKGNVYATILDWQDKPITLKALRTGGATLGKVTKVELLGADLALTFVQDDQGLTVTPAGPAEPLAGITNQQLALGCRILRITHDKGWINDDDPGAAAPGWLRRCNLGTSDFNNDLTTSDTPDDVWSCTFTGSSIAVIAPKEPGAGKIEIQIDGETLATADLSTTGTRQAQQTVCEVSGLTPGKHAIKIVNRGLGPVAVDALIIR